MTLTDNVIGWLRYGRTPMPVLVLDVKRWVNTLQDHHREFLAQGPLPQPECRCCELFDQFWDDKVGYSSAVIEYLVEFHHNHDDDEEGELRSYLACLYIYLCAGWDGVQHGEQEYENN